MPKTHHTCTIEDDFGDSHEYQIDLHGGIESSQIVRKLAKLIMPTVTRVIGAVKNMEGGLDTMELDGQEASLAITTALDVIVEYGEEKFFLQLLKFVVRDKAKMTKEVFNEAYQGNIGELFDALYWAVERNYGNFFRRRISPLIARFKTKTPTSEPGSASLPSSSKVALIG